MKTSIRWGLIFLLVTIPVQSFGEEVVRDIPPVVRGFVDGFIQDYNEKNFKKIYKDFSTGRFKASINFVDFHNSILNVFDDLGRAQKYEIDYLFLDSYNFGEFFFYRLQMVVQHDKGETVQRLVLMKRQHVESLELDGVAVASRGVFYVAIGNLYNFDIKDLVGDKDTLWASKYFNAVWQDAKRDYLRGETFKKKIIDNSRESFRSVIRGDFDTAVKLIKDPGEVHVESYSATEMYGTGKTKWIVPYVNGKKNGEVQFFYEDGQLWQSVSYKNNMPHGDFVEFYPNGQIRFKVRYVNGAPAQEAEAFYENGKIMAKFEFVFGLLLYKYEEFGEGGNLKEEGTYLLGNLMEVKKYEVKE